MKVRLGDSCWEENQSGLSKLKSQHLGERTAVKMVTPYELVPKDRQEWWRKVVWGSGGRYNF